MVCLRSLFNLLFLVAITIATTQTYQPNWSSINSRPIPQWYDDAKFGIFIHWGVYSVPAWSPVGSYAEWYWNSLEQGPSNPTYQFHHKTYGDSFSYQDFAPMWKAELWNPDQWADLFLRSGAKYIVPTSKHHEGFTLWQSVESWNWNSVDVGPGRDLIGDLFKSVRSKGLRACAYYSLYEWYNPLYKGPNPHQYVDQVMLPQLYDLIKTYQPELIFSDGDWEQTPEFWNATDFLAWLYNDSPVRDTVVVNDRWGKGTRGVDGGYYTSEYSAQVWLDHKWELNRGIDVFSFGYNRNSQAGNYTSTNELLYTLIKTVAYGGNLLLDVGPSADGEIPVVMQDRLLDIGNWLSINGEAIYNTRAWDFQMESYNTTFYTWNPKTENVYVIFVEWPESNELKLTFPQPTSKTIATMFGVSNPLKFSYDAKNGMIVQLPYLTPNKNPSPYAWSIKLTNLQPTLVSVPLQDWWSGSRSDNAICGTQECLNQLLTSGAGYGRVRIEGLALKDKSTDSLIPLILYYSSANQDYALVTNSSVLSSSYQLIGVQGYIFQNQERGTVPLTLWWSEDRKDFYLVGSDKSMQDAVASHYINYGIQGYSYPGPTYNS